MKDFSKWLMDCSVHYRSSSIAVYKELFSLVWVIKDSPPVLVPTSPRLNRAAMVRTVMGSLLNLRIESGSQCWTTSFSV